VEYILIRLGIVGAGSIVQSHIDAAKLSGFSPIAICGRKGSIRATKLAETNHGLLAVASLSELLQLELDAILIAVSTEDAVGVLEKCIESNLPILIEKPISSDPEILKRLNGLASKQVRVGYNRRFYSSVSKLKEELIDQTGLVQVIIPELSIAKNSNAVERISAVLENSVHILDLLGYLFGEVNIVQKNVIKSRDNFDCINAQVKLGDHFIGSVNIVFEASENSSIKCWIQGKSLELMPIENFKKSTKMKLVLPSATFPVKRYEKVFDAWEISHDDKIAKPGFLGQYNDFKTFISGAPSDKLATLQDALNVVKLACSLLDDLSNMK
jgi:predicted dehydrogenase